ncbi:hypothetical protein [Oceanivirga salmonicida]|uniref:hypothetical protein n=1 Tax=Oceanivirga salmonicida TaxID=1769291 RepID=UPI0018D24FB9|nr:hypothetical protein [Oceanivirga salmonicida]
MKIKDKKAIIALFINILMYIIIKEHYMGNNLKKYLLIILMILFILYKLNKILIDEKLIEVFNILFIGIIVYMTLYSNYIIKINVLKELNIISFLSVLLMIEVYFFKLSLLDKEIGFFILILFAYYIYFYLIIPKIIIYLFIFLYNSLILFVKLKNKWKNI